MQMCRLTVHAPDGAWQGEVNSWTGWVVLAALSAEPESLAELAQAVCRYQPEHRLFEPLTLSGSEKPESGGPWCLVDLASHTVIAGGGFELPDPHGAYQADESDQAEGFPIIWLDTPEDWLFQQAEDAWRSLLTARASARAQIRRFGPRPVLFGSPLLQHLATGVLAAGTASVETEETQLEGTRAIHAEWLLTARADLYGRTPREILLAQRHHIDMDLQHRSDQWSQQRYPVPPLALDSAAYRFGGFGTTQVVLYFDMVRALLDETWKLAASEPRLTRTQLSLKLAEFRDEWLERPLEDCMSRLTTTELMERERRRLPVAGDGPPIDPDCPICQAEAEGHFGLGFFFFDGHHLELEDIFAFSLCTTREEWESKQEEYRQFSEKWDREAKERAAAPDAGDELAGSVWQSSLVNWDGLADSGASPLLALGFPLAEVVSVLRDRADATDLVGMLNAAYARLRTSQDQAARDSAAHELGEVLEQVCAWFPDLTPRCADLQSRLDEVLRQLS